MKQLISIVLCSVLFIKTLPAQECFARFSMREAMQQAPMWCWAATIQTIMDFHDPDNSIDQCDIVKDYFNVEECEEESMSGGYMRNIRTFLRDNNLGATFSSSYTQGALPVSTISNNILNCKPIIIEIRVSPFSNSTHAVVIMGIWQQVNQYGQPYYLVVLRDPYPYSWNSLINSGFEGIEYNRLRSIWLSSLYNITPQ